MSSIKALAGIVFLTLSCVSASSKQDAKPQTSDAAPPNLLLLVHQEFQHGKAAQHKKLQASTASACDRLGVPSFWIALQSLTGPREVLFLNLLDSFDQLEQSTTGWGQLYAAHPELAQMREEIDALVVSEQTIVAVRRDDLGYRADSIDLSGTRFMRVLEVHLFPGHEGDFVDSLRALEEAYDKVAVDMPWVVYQLNVGTPSPTFFILAPLVALKQNDDLLELRQKLLEAEGDQGTQRLQQTAREAYASTESNLYAVSAEMSHVPKEFADTDADFWRPGTQPAAKANAKPARRNLP